MVRPLYISQADMDDVDDIPEIPAESFAQARPFAEVFPELAANMRRGRGPQKAPTKERVTLRIDRDVLEAFRATGDGWQTRLNDALAKAAPAVETAPPDSDTTR